MTEKFILNGNTTNARENGNKDSDLSTENKKKHLEDHVNNLHQKNLQTSVKLVTVENSNSGSEKECYTLPLPDTVAVPPHAHSSTATDTVSHFHGIHESNIDNEDAIFGKYIASELQQIENAHLKRVVKHKIQNLIFEAHCSLLPGAEN